MSGRGYVPGMYTTSDIPPAPFAKDLPPHMRIQLEALAHRSSIETDAAAHQTHHALHRSVAELQSIHPKARPSAQPQIRSESMFPQHWPLEDFHTQQPQRLYVLNGMLNISDNTSPWPESCSRVLSCCQHHTAKMFRKRSHLRDLADNTIHQFSGGQSKEAVSAVS